MEIGESLQHLGAILLIFVALVYFYVRDEEHDELLKELEKECHEDYKETILTINDFNKKAHPAIIDNFYDRWQPFVDPWLLNHRVRQMQKKSSQHTKIDLRYLYN